MWTTFYIIIFILVIYKYVGVGGREINLHSIGFQAGARDKWGFRGGSEVSKIRPQPALLVLEDRKPGSLQLVNYVSHG